MKKTETMIQSKKSIIVLKVIGAFAAGTVAAVFFSHLVSALMGIILQ